MKEIKKINKLSWKLSWINYSATFLGVVLWSLCTIFIFKYISYYSENLGILFPVAMIFGLQLASTLIKIIPTPISTYETEVVK